MLWLSLAVLVAASVGGVVYAVVKWRALWRDAKGFMATTGEALEVLGNTWAAVGTRPERDPERLGRSLDRLQRSRAELAVLLDAVSRVRAQGIRVRAVYPKK